LRLYVIKILNKSSQNTTTAELLKKYIVFIEWMYSVFVKDAESMNRWWKWILIYFYKSICGSTVVILNIWLP